MKQETHLRWNEPEWVQARLSVLIRRRAHNFRIARRTGVAHLGVIGKREHRIQEPP
jgi:hypothetical protein